MQLQWSVLGVTDTIATIKVNLQHLFGARWTINHDNVNKFRQRIQDNSHLINCLNESLDLIPLDDPFVTM